jgi:hypothetical protein
LLCGVVERSTDRKEGKKERRKTEGRRIIFNKYINVDVQEANVS